MVQAKHLFHYLIGFMLAGALSCKDGHSPENEQVSGYKTIHITMNSPYSCYNEIQLGHAGSGTSIFGYHNGQNGKSDIENKMAFIIRTDSEKTQLANLINRVRDRKPVYSTRGLDLYQFIVEIDGEKYVDKYGKDSLIDKILIGLLPYIQIDQKEQCDYFYFLSQISC